jgi:hypothetical protein
MQQSGESEVFFRWLFCDTGVAGVLLFAGVSSVNPTLSVCTESKTGEESVL